MKRGILCAVFLLAAAALVVLPARGPEALPGRFVALAGGGEIEPVRWQGGQVAAIDDCLDVPAGREGADILALYLDGAADGIAFRVSMTQMRDPVSGLDLFGREKPVLLILLDYADGGRTALPGGVEGEGHVAWEEAVVLDPFAADPDRRAVGYAAAGDLESRRNLSRAFLSTGGEFLEGKTVRTRLLALAAGAGGGSIVAEPNGAGASLDLRAEVVSVVEGKIVDRLIGSTLAPSGDANCAFVHHGNQGLAYSDVFLGRWDDPDGSGFDEQLEIHEATSIPGNFHLSAPLQTSAEWDANSGDPMDFNAWLAAGVTAGWAGMVTSAYGQHIMPFVQDDMNDWSVYIQAQMTSARYGYTPRVAWVPERVWLHPSFYPNAGVNDDPSDNFTPHGVWAVILDDDVHCQGYDNHQIHTISGTSLKVIPRDRSFTGNIVGGNGAAALQTLTDLANSGVGEYRLVLFAEDWEACAEMGSWASATPNAKETYDWFIGKCSEESAWLHVWKVADAVSNPDFTGTTMNVTFGTYNEIGGTGGYGGGDNGWYTHWAGYVPYANGGDGSGNCDPVRGGNCKNFGTLWNDAFTALSAAPDNDISQAGWYCLMTNLHETGWHDGLGGDISGWQINYASHIKNTNMYAEAAHWGNGEYQATTAAFLSDIDNDGHDEVIVHNDRLFAVFEGIGARAVNVFAKGSGYAWPVVGVDNAYWAGTSADYNDVNHVGCFSDVGPNYQHEVYGIEIVDGTGPAVSVRFTHADLVKTVTLVEGQPYLDVVYEVGEGTQYVKNGYSPDLVDLVWNAEMERVWVSDASYMGQRNPNTGATAALVLGGGGAAHNFDFSARIMKGDEIYGSGVFEYLLWVGQTAAPAPDGEIAELRALATALADTIGPRATGALYYPGTDKLRIEFNQVTQYATLDPAGVSIDDDDDGVAELTLSASTTVVETADGHVLTLQLTSADAAVLEGLDTGALELMMAAGAASDANGIGGDALTNEDDVKVRYGAATSITIDGYLDPAEWGACELAVADSNDSEWTAENEIDGLSVSWDSLYLYVAIDGIVTGNSWILYLDTDPGGPGGETDLTAIDHWERGATFSAAGFAVDYYYGCYQHQGAYDSDSFFRVESATTSTDLSDSVVTAFDASHAYGDLGGSELALPWDLLYGLGAGAVPANASIALVASVCWDPEPDGVLGGDSAPSNVSAALPAVDAAHLIVVDADGGGRPDPEDTEGPALVEARRDEASDSLVNVLFDEPVEETSAGVPTNYTVFETSVPSNTVAVLSATLQPDGVTVQLALAEPVYYAHSLAVSYVTDVSCNANEIEQGSTTEILPSVTGGDTPVAWTGALMQNYPNPFNPATTIRFEVPGSVGRGAAGAVPVTLAVYDVRGRLVRTLVADRRAPGRYEAAWDGRNDGGRRVSSGIYFYRLAAGDFTRTRKMVLLR